MNDTSKPKKPTHNVYARVPKGIESRIGSRIGVGWAHSEGQGVNIVLDALPIPEAGQIELIIFPADTTA